MPKFPFPKPPRPPNPIGQIREIVREGRQLVNQAKDEIRSIANEVRGSVAPEPPKQTSEETKSDKEECPVCETLTDLKEYIGKRKVKTALSELEKSGDKESVETIKRYIEGEDVV